jgi:Holliday junction DNA helicase RuvA
MIATLTGPITHQATNHLTIDVHGVGYLVHCPTNLISNFETSKPGNVETIFVHTHVTENQLALYGFTNRADLSIFQQLITVSGIGPRIGLAILNTASADQIIQAITSADVTFFTQVPGIGKKGAQKIIVDLKSKLGSLAELDLQESVTTEQQQLLDALTGLGFKSTEAIQAIKQLPPDITQLEDQIRHILKQTQK